MKKVRFIYAIAFALLLLTEIAIALFVHDGFIRPYMGDVLVTVLICCFIRIFIPKSIPFLPLFVFLFATLVETAQYFDIVKLLGLENNVFLSVLIGRSFSFLDILCYGAGCLAFWLTEKAIKKIGISKAL